MYSAHGVLLSLATDVLLAGVKHISSNTKISCLGKMLESISLCGMKILLDNIKQMKAFPVLSLQQEKGAALSYLIIFWNIVATKSC